MRVIDQRTYKILPDVLVLPIVLPRDREQAGFEAAADPENHKIAAVLVNVVEHLLPLRKRPGLHPAECEVISANAKRLLRRCQTCEQQCEHGTPEEQRTAVAHISSSTVSKSCGRTGGISKPAITAAGHFTAAPVAITTRTSPARPSAARAHARAADDAGSIAYPARAAYCAAAAMSSSLTATAVPPDSYNALKAWSPPIGSAIDSAAVRPASTAVIRLEPDW